MPGEELVMNGSVFSLPETDRLEKTEAASGRHWLLGEEPPAPPSTRRGLLFWFEVLETIFFFLYL